jgi:V/A-type H+/Na+-transporting ATPase subunit E
MGLEVVVNEIIQEGQKEAQRIEREGLEEAKAILEDARSKAEGILDERQQLADKEAERIRTQEAARTEFEAKRSVLTAKRALWERLKKETLQALSQLDEDTRRDYLDRLLENARKEIPRGTIHVRKEDTGLVKAAGFQVEGDLDGIGGLVVEDESGAVSLDLRFETLLQDLWPQVLKQESKRLFG